MSRLLAVLAFLAGAPLAAQQSEALPVRLMFQSCHTIERDCPHGDSVVFNGRRNALPEYPKVLSSVGLEGTVDLVFDIRPNGTVDTASFQLTVAGHRAFGGFLSRTVRDWVFDPLAPSSDSRSRRIALHVVYSLIWPCDDIEDRTFWGFGSDDHRPDILVLRCQGESRAVND